MPRGGNRTWRGIALSSPFPYQDPSREEADPDARNLVAVLDGIPGACERAVESLQRGRAGETIALQAEVKLSVPAIEDSTHSQPSGQLVTLAGSLPGLRAVSG